MYEEDEDVDGVDIQFHFAEVDNADLGLGVTASTEEVVEHNRDFEVSILKEHTNTVKRKVATVEEDVKGVANKVVDVEGRVKQVDEQLANLSAQLEEMKESKAKETEVVYDSDSHLFDLVDTASKEMEINKNKEMEDIADKAAQKAVASVKTDSEPNSKKTKDKPQAENVGVSGFKDGVTLVVNLVAKILGIVFALFLIYLGNLLINPTAIVPENLVPLVEVIRVCWDAVLNFVAWVFKWIMGVINFIKK